ncbi:MULTISPECIES: TonB-dependent hemoglobin/transferrin/lactoferrin family receptor [unclassified Caulobacter]|jgi:hemoglobin/transferrin/lactoferrin receptor protein|uniref:TonB-dependent hemoglobin/transferrin/lactoferrin family receptor n=1 Tax=unclassified Caulobacter TaxID=2648921 RepID=UPI0007809E1C|nr:MULTISPECIES: TonB-dependent hemoglobin/transferrin/lactoferrin family receptor [unclassified Caulobacter]AZS21982.1 TonB-dependent hemoglobin/transferrin/lactoferrin family receptor [Caulobacter sp. FWC26]
MSRLKLAALAAASTAALLATAARADDAKPESDAVELDKVTVTATRSEKALSKAPASVTVISAQEIEDGLIKDIKDLVRGEPGVSVRNAPARFTAAGASTGRDGNAGFNIRGLEGNRVLIVVDGVRVPDSFAFGAQSVGRGDQVDLDTLKSVEIVRGPASALYGSDGLAGSVSFITKDPSDILKGGDAFAGRARIGYASADESWTESALLAGQVGRWEGLLTYTRRDGEGQKTAGTNASANTDRTTANPEDNQSNAILAKLIYSPDDHNRFRLTVDHLDRDVDWTVLSAIAKPPLAATSVIGLTAFDKVKRDRVSLDHRFDGGQGLIDSAHTTLYWQKSTTRQFSAEDRNTAVDRTRDATFDNRVLGASAELHSRFDHGALTHDIVWGGDASITRQRGVRGGTVPPAGETFPARAFPTTDFTLAGLYVQDEIKAGRLALYPALRLDYYKLDPKTDPLFHAATAGQSDTHLSPKLGLVWEASDLVTVFANAATGFKAPSPSQVNTGFSNPVSNYQSISNPDLKPETSRTLEAGLRLGRESWRLSVTGFTGDYDDFIEQVQVGGNFTAASPAVYQYVNLTGVTISGAEAKGSVVLGAGFTARAAVAYAKGSSKAKGVSTPLVSIDPLKITGGLGYRAPSGRFGGDLSVIHADRKSASRTGVTCAGGCFTPAAFTVADATAWWSVTEAVTVRAGVFNLTDEKYWWWSDVRGLSDTSVVKDAYSQPGRNYSISLALKF